MEQVNSVWWHKAFTMRWIDALISNVYEERKKKNFMPTDAI